MIFKIIGLEVDGTDQIFLRLRRSFHSPGLFRRRALAVLELQRFHHLADEAVGQNDGGVAIFVGQFEGQRCEIGHLLHGGGSEDEIVVVPMASPLHHGEIVALLRGDVAEARAAAHYIDDHAWKFGACNIGDAFLHQAQTWAGGGGHDARAGRSRAVDHVDGGDFAFRLQECSADLRDIKSGGLGDLAGGCDGISVEGTASGENRAFHDRNVALTELPHGCLLGALRP